mmetsp:Transcript_11304/g.13350  ORF Transcript_11304/g.13350 Transcript_11304/m.13350 type:complete len:234 (-) Transcript_11304:228-929(-)|eukprot:CAMPEP_0197843862 /NCGR_PEP_ID=MMETSP1438-20131217/832_1 /TAXON_ID=1461541 /ORGANISM="Pterosperma sp., Strain CCMP1384" /LENGTH=233 /DNA_ID=CAMNT_0043454303 /DNA_START=119 /DNA_END=820 /DNA_ORIENTATION=+
MGAGASSTSQDPKYALPIQREDNSCLFQVVPLNDTVKAKTTLCLLEVSPHGFRILRLHSEDPLFDFPFPQIHSWGHMPNKFSFRFYEERTKGITLYAFETKLVDDLIAFIHTTIDRILEDRKNAAMSEADFETLFNKLQECESPDRLPQLETATQLNYFTAVQGSKLVTTLDSTFDKVEAAVLLQFALVDQNHFSTVLKSLESQEDRDNVLHRVQAEKTKRKRQGPGTNAASS